MRVQCKILTRPDVSAPVLFDLNVTKDSEWLHADEFDLGEPEFTVNPDGSLEEGTRTVRLPLRVRGTHDQAQEMLGHLARALMDPRARWLLWQIDNDLPPTFFRLHPSASGSMDFQRVYADNEDGSTWQWNVDVVANAFAYGERRTQEVTLSYSNSNMSVKLPSPGGDVPTRLRVDVNPGRDLVGAANLLAVAALPRGEVAALPVWEAEVFTARSGYGKNTYAGVSPSRLSAAAGQGGNTCILAPGTMFPSRNGGLFFSGTAPASIYPGEWKVLARVVNLDGGACSPSYRAGLSAYGQRYPGQWSTWQCPADATAGYMSWLDCGQIQVPAGIDPTDMDPDEVGAPDMLMWHRGDGSSKRTAIDLIALVPTRPVVGRGSVMNVGWGYYAGLNSLNRLRVDDIGNRVGVVDLFGRKWTPHAPPTLHGGFPVTCPGYDNWLTWIPNVQRANAPATTEQTTTHTVTVTVSWMPRYLHMGSL